MYEQTPSVVTLYAYRAHNGQVRVLYSRFGSVPAPFGSESDIISQVGVRGSNSIEIFNAISTFFGTNLIYEWIIENEEDINVTLQRIGAMIND